MSKTPTREELQIHAIELRKAALIFRAMNHKLRQKIMRLLHQGQKIAVTEIYTTLALEQSVASQHLAILRKAGFVNAEREGKHIYYSVNYKRLIQAHSIA